MPPFLKKLGIEKPEDAVQMLKDKAADLDVSSATEVYGLMLTTMSRPDEGSFTKSCWTCGAWTIRKSRSTAPLCPAQNRFAHLFVKGGCPVRCLPTHSV